ncbi:glutamate synthase subunit beta [Pseudobacteriovorax antillogorgiicola]|uniref:Glutamate synthase (NADH) small subunit n=1 Tax=Pseudobacteriovorax antillogorgiicola TaxID=1513793 RepID=A0A1Y6BWI7_9BACT|nr:glutamate synthase subunit beta [Pseudobacteriovorax antillogorgiicola]TCS50236.1 glutamate synthase (NADH) small subunit [Pseudobacteriovorax antillogorgiicola]SMF32754.1 glutamate synthase (NADH) small subunit [Pseudobacteriovorax antillogorgiicola]
MGELNGFRSYSREVPRKQPVENRVQHFKEFVEPLSDESLREQGARCMDCGVPFCHQGCPLGNLIPEWNDLSSAGHWQEALEVLHSTNNFPEFTGRVCPAPCETSCVLGINEDPVSIEAIEMALADRGFAEGWVQPQPPAIRTGKSVAVVGSGPAGLAAAQQLNRKGHHVTVFERDDRPGGLLTYGIPDFKLEKAKVFRRVKQIQDEGVSIRCGVHIGRDMSLEQLKKDFDAVLLSCGATKKRDLPIDGRELQGIYFADTILRQSTRRVLGDVIHENEVTAKGKHVVVIGGGDTGSDCVGTSNRQGAKSITQFEIMEMPPSLGKYPRALERDPRSPWPNWPYMLRTSTSHEEGVDRHWCLQTKRFVGNDQGQVTGLVTEQVRWMGQGADRRLELVPGSEKEWPCDLALLAIGFTGPETEGLVQDAHLKLGKSGNIEANDLDYLTSVPGVFTAGDMRRGQSLVVWAIQEGRQAAESIHRYLSP